MKANPNSLSVSLERPWSRWGVFHIAFVTFAYILTGKLGFFLAAPPGNVTAVWPPSGIALAALIILGPRAGWGVWFGAFILNCWFFGNSGELGLTGFLVAAGISCGSTIQALVAAFLVRKTIGSNGSLDSSPNVLKFVGISLVTCLIAATFGVLALCMGSVLPWIHFSHTWLTWWTGDVGGVLIFTPLVLTWTRIPKFERSFWRVTESFLFILSLVFLGGFAFSSISPFATQHYPFLFFLFPLILWAGFRYGESGVTATTFFIGMFAIWGTKSHLGPFGALPLNTSLILLQSFLWIFSLMGLFLSAVLSERRRAVNVLAGAQKQLMLVTNSVPALISFIDREERYQFVNGAYRKWFGKSATDMVGKTMQEVLGIEARNKIEKYIKMALSGQEVSFEAEIPYLEGGTRYVSASYVPDYGSDGKVRGFVALVADVSEKKKAEAKLRSIEAANLVEEVRLQLACESGGVGCWTFDLKRDRIVWSVQQEKIFGLAPNSFSGSLEEVSSFVHPDDLNEMVSRFKVALQSADKYESNYRIIRRDGAVRWINSRGKIRRDQNNIPTEVIGVVIDITDQKLSEIALIESEERLRRAVAQAPIPMIIHDESDKILTVSKGWTEFSGYTIDDIPTITAWTERAYGERKTLLKKYIDDLFEIGATVHNGEFQIHPKSGSDRTWNFFTTPISTPDRGQRVLLSLAIDVTETKQAEKQLKDSEEKFRATFNQAAVGIAHVGTDGRWKKVNQRLCDIVEYSEEELLKIDFQRITHPDDLNADLNNVRQMLSGTIQTYSMEKRYIKKSGQVVWINLTVSLVRDSQGSPEYFIAVVEDISEKRAATEAIDRINQELEYRVEQRTKELKRSNLDLEQFAYVASHDLQEPLRSVINNCQALEELYSEKINRRDEEYLRLAIHGARRMQSLVQGLLDYSRLSGGEGGLKLVECTEIVGQVLTSLKDSIEREKAIIKCGNLPNTCGSPLQIERLFQNLIGNAIKFHGSSKPHIEVGTMNSSEGVVFFVKDNGIGIASHQLQKIFIIFQRLHSREEYPGTGIGLAICKKIVEEHNGKIWVESELGKGSTFYFTIGRLAGEGIPFKKAA